MFTPDPDFFYIPDPTTKKRRGKHGSCSHKFLDTELFNFILTGAEIEIRDPEKKLIPDPGSGSATLTPTYPPHPSATIS
jgi:hypothetical protein